MALINERLYIQAIPVLRQALKLLQESDSKALEKQIRRVKDDITQLEEVLDGKGLYWCQVIDVKTNSGLAFPRQHTATADGSYRITLTGGVHPSFFGPVMFSAAGMLKFPMKSTPKSPPPPPPNARWECTDMKAETGLTPPPLIQHSDTHLLAAMACALDSWRTRSFH